jgi:hypothetical protein
MFLDQLQLSVFFDDGDDLAPNFLSEQNHLDVLIVLEAVADNRRFVVGDGEHREEFRLRTGFQAELVGAAVFENFLDHLALLIDLDGIDAAVTALVIVFGNRVLKRAVHFAQAVLEDFAEANQDGQGDAAKLEIVNQLFQVKRAGRVLIGVHPQVTVRTDGEVAFAPTGDIVELACLGSGPAVGRFAHRSAVRNSHRSHEFSVSL